MLTITFTTSDFISYLIKWDDPYPYPECFNLSVTVDDNLVFASNNGSTMNYNLTFSDPLSLRYVCVNATDQRVQSVVKCTTLISGKCRFVGTLYGHLSIIPESASLLCFVYRLQTEP